MEWSPTASICSPKEEPLLHPYFSPSWWVSFNKTFFWCIIVWIWSGLNATAEWWRVAPCCICFASHDLNWKAICPNRKRSFGDHLGKWALHQLPNWPEMPHWDQHSPLIPLLSTRNLEDLPARVQCFWLRMMRFSYSISHVPDWLSPCPWE